VDSISNTPEMMKARPLIVHQQGEKYVVLAGNMRLRAMRELKWHECPCAITAEGTDAKKLREYAIKDNVAFGEDDMDLLANEWDLEELTEWGKDLNFPEIEENDTSEIIEDDCDANAEVEHISKEGDVFILGDHRLICGDSLKAETYQKLMQGCEADLMVTDPPYNVAYEGATDEHMTIKNDNMKDSEFFQFLHQFYLEVAKHIKKGGGYYIWHASSETHNFASALKETSLLLKLIIVWVKNTMVLGRQDYQWKHELCIYGWKEGASHYFCDSRKETTVLNFDKPLRNAEHPTMKPVELFAYLIKNSSRKGEVVLDPFGGSGTTIMACEQLGRKARVVELDPKYCDRIITRWKNFTGKKVIKINSLNTEN
jgi:site-specific DNA-methyltransferase (adenine-specific)